MIKFCCPADSKVAITETGITAKVYLSVRNVLIDVIGYDNVNLSQHCILKRGKKQCYIIACKKVSFSEMPHSVGSLLGELRKEAHECKSFLVQYHKEEIKEALYERAF